MRPPVLPNPAPTPESRIAERMAQHGAQSRRARSRDTKAVDAHRQRRAERATRLQALKDERQANRAFRKFMREALRDRHLWKPVKLRSAQRPMIPTTKEKGSRPTFTTSFPAYGFDVIDRKGRRGIFLKISYDGALDNRLGVVRRRILYAANSAEVAMENGRPLLVSNVARDVAEAVIAGDELEAYARSERANAKLNLNLIIRFPWGAGPKEQEKILRLFCQRMFGDEQLPYIAFIHRPEKQGKMHNPHAHIVASFRPMVRLGAYNWLLGKELRTDLDGSEGCLAMRKILAEVTTRVMKDAGIHHEYTHLSNLDRGLAALPQEPLTKAQSEAVLRGETVAANERNRDRIAANRQRLLGEIRKPQVQHAQPLGVSKPTVHRALRLTSPTKFKRPLVAIRTQVRQAVIPVLKRPVMPANWSTIDRREGSNGVVRTASLRPPAVSSRAVPSRLNPLPLLSNLQHETATILPPNRVPIQSSLTPQPVKIPLIVMQSSKPLQLLADVVAVAQSDVQRPIQIPVFALGSAQLTAVARLVEPAQQSRRISHIAPPTILQNALPIAGRSSQFQANPRSATAIHGHIHEPRVPAQAFAEMPQIAHPVRCGLPVQLGARVPIFAPARDIVRATPFLSPTVRKAHRAVGRPPVIVHGVKAIRAPSPRLAVPVIAPVEQGKSTATIQVPALGMARHDGWLLPSSRASLQLLPAPLQLQISPFANDPDIAAAVKATDAAANALRMSVAKEKQARALVDAIDGEALMKRLRDERIYLAQRPDGRIEVADPAGVSEAERQWILRNQLSLMSLRIDQQGEIAQVAALIEPRIEALRNGTLKVSKEMGAAWTAFAADPLLASLSDRAWGTPSTAQAGPSTSPAVADLAPMAAGKGPKGPDSSPRLGPAAAAAAAAAAKGREGR